MKQALKRILIMLLTAALSALLAACGNAANEEETAVVEETPAPRVFYQTKTAEIAAGNEAVLFQQGCEDRGFLAFINRKTGDNIPPEALEDEDFINDGRYDIYESALFRVTEKGKREKIRRYRTMPAPEDTEDRKEYYSEQRPRAFRMKEDGSILALESSYESWLDPKSSPQFQTECHWYLRCLASNGTALACHELQFDPEKGAPECSKLQLVVGGLAAIPQGNAVLFFDESGQLRFSVTTPFPIKDLCSLKSGRLAVILCQEGKLWVSLIDPVTKTATVPSELPEDAHSFCSGPAENSLCYLRNTEVFCYEPETETHSRLTSLLSIGIHPAETAAFFVRADGSLHFLMHFWQPDQTSREVYAVVSPTFEADGRKEIGISFMTLSDRLAQAVIDFNRQSSQYCLTPTDYANLSRAYFFSDEHQLVVMDETTLESFRRDARLFSLETLLQEDNVFSTADLIPSVRKALSDTNGRLCAVAPVFRIETMAADFDSVGGKNQLSFQDLTQLRSEMPDGSTLYEPYYTADRLLEALQTVNRNQNESQETLTDFSDQQPKSYDYRNYSDDTSSMESRIYDGRLLLMQAHIGSLEELKWYDAFFPSEASFVGWPTDHGSASILRFDEILGIGAGIDAEARTGAWQFLRTILDGTYMKSCYGFPVLQNQLAELLDEDASDIIYQVDEKGRWKRNDRGERIEAARDSWYSPEWRRHYEYSLTPSQREKLMTMIENAVA